MKNVNYFAILLVLSPNFFAFGYSDPVDARTVCRFPGMNNLFNPEQLRNGSFPGYGDPMEGCDVWENFELVPFEGYNPSDSPQISALGVNPATLVPEGLDLDIFPSFPLSEELALNPSLSYSADSTLSRRGFLSYGDPKKWRNHYGEIVRVIPSTAETMLDSLGFQKNSEDEYGDREAIPVEIQTYFVNAQGQEVNFYPHPNPTPSTEATWISSSGEHRLTRLSGIEDGYLLATKSGLEFQFKRYKSYLNSGQEVVAVHYKVTRITDRYGNNLRISYRNETSGNISDSLQPTTVRAYKQGSETALQEISYTYDAQDRLKRIVMPKPIVGDPEEPAITRNTDENYYQLYYPDETGFSATDLHQSGLAGTGNVSGTNISLDPVPLVLGQAQTSFPAWLESSSASVYLNLANLQGRLLGPVTDYANSDSESLVSLKKGRYFLKVTDGTNTNTYLLDFGKENFRGGDVAASPVRYRYQLDEYGNGYPNVAGFVVDDYPHRITATRISGETYNLADGACTMTLFPALKIGDTFIDGSGERFVLTSNHFESGTGMIKDPQAINAAGANLSGPVSLLRADNLERIAAIEFPKSATADYTWRKMVIQYDDWTPNHQEIKKVINYNENDRISETEYTYQMVRSLGTHEEALQRSLHDVSSTSPFNSCGSGIDFTRGNTIDDIKVGIDPGSREQEICLLRRKTVRFAQTPGGPLSSQELVTQYGGSYHYTMAGVRRDPEIEPAESYCRFVQWSLDGKLFDYTWMISPDGSAQVYDLNPDGLNLDPFLKHQGRRSQTFKTYYFDTSFESAFQGLAPEYLNLQPYYRFMPGYPPDSVNPPSLTDVAANPQDYFVGLAYPPSLEELFETDFSSKCYRADINAFEPVATYPYKLNDHFMARTTLKAVHGSAKRIQATSTFDTVHFRSSGVQFLAAGETREGASVISNPGPADIEKFLEGKLSSDLDATYESTTLDETVAWDLGGLTGVGNRIQPFNDHVQINKLKPSFTYTVSNLDGLRWDEGKGTIDLDHVDNPAHFSNGTRFSNGGFITDHVVLADLARDTSSLPFNLTAAGLMPGDVFVAHKLYYKVTQVGASTHFEPPLRMGLNVGDTIRFYRYHMDGQNTDRYQGYDSFGNNGYAEVYQGPDSIEWDTSNNEGFLLPDFSDSTTIPSNISVNNSTAATNNRPSDWLFFGRVTESYTRTSRPFYLYNLGNNPLFITSDALNYKWYTIHTPDTDFPWKIATSTEHYLPTLTTVSPHAEDRITHNDFFADSTGNAPFQGRLQRTRNYLAGDSTTFSMSQFHYDEYGNVDWIKNASFKNGVADFGTMTSFVREGNTGLPIQEASFAGPASVVGDDLSITPHFQSRIYRDYDFLGRETLSYMEDARDGQSPSATFYQFGPITHTKYISLLETEVKTTSDRAGTVQLSRVRSILDGLSRKRFERTQEGIGSKTYETVTTYDEVGRLAQTYAPAEQSIDLTARGFTTHVYNQRGEAAGQIITNYNGSSQEPEVSQWTYRAQDPTGLGLVYQVQQSLDENVGSTGITHLNIKKTNLNGFSQVARVRDYRLPQETGTGWNQLFHAGNGISESKLVIDALEADLLLQNPVAVLEAEANYSFDHANRVIEAQVGTANLQTRHFKFDQRGRLRYEDHPEMAANQTMVTYDHFDLFDMPGTILNHNLQGERKTVVNYDAQGNQISSSTFVNSSSTADLTTNWSYRYSLTGLNAEPYQYPNLLASNTRNSDTGEGILYRYNHDRDTGLMTAKIIEPTLPGFTTTYQIDFDYDDLSRRSHITYPLAATGQTQRTQLEYNYDDMVHAQLRSIKDLSLSGDPVLIDDISYGVAGLESYRFGPSAGTSEHRNRVVIERDGLNRIHKYRYTHVGLDVLETIRAYDYDLNSRVKNINMALKGADEEDSQAVEQADLSHAYDSLGQISEYHRTGSEVSEHQIIFDYDEFGNLIHRNENGNPVSIGTSASTNQKQGFTYNVYGEMVGGSFDATNFSMIYSPDGRLIQQTVDNETDVYFYDANGMRVLVKGHDGTDRFYLYDEANMILSEMVKESGDARWDKSYLYLGGNSVITLEHDEPQAPDPVPNPPPIPEMSPYTITFDRTISWQTLGEQLRYDLQLANNEGEILKTYTDLSTTSKKLHDIHHGAYQIRVRVVDGVWGDWNKIVYTNAENVETLGRYEMEGSLKDTSDYQNEGLVSGAVPDAGFTGVGYSLDGDDQIDLADPMTYSSSQEMTLVGWFKPTPAQGSNLTRNLLSYDQAELLITDAGQVAIQWQGGTPVTYHNINNDTWNQVALTFGQNTLNLYINGLFKQSLTALPAELTGSITLGQGNQPDGFLGFFDEFLTYNRVLTETEIVNGASSLYEEVYLSFEGGSFDAFGRVVTEIGNIQFEGGNRGSALSLDGFGEALHIDPILDPKVDSPFTLAAWVNLSSDSGWKTIVGTEGSFAQIAVRDRSIRFGRNSSNGWWLIGPEIELGAWHHVVGVYDGTSASLYLDGQLVDGPRAGSYAVTHGVSLIGRYGAIKGEWMDGLIDDVHIYNRPLTTSEVNGLYTAEFVTEKQASYAFEGNFNDLSGQNHHGTQTGGVGFATGHSGSGVSLDGVDDAIHLNQILTTDKNTAFTLSAWVKVESETGWGTIVGTEGSFAQLAVNSLELRFGQNGPGGWWLVGPKLELGLWYKVTGVYDGTVAKLYVNGAPVAGPLARDFDQDHGISLIGRNAINDGEWFKGVIDDVSIIDWALHMRAVQAIYQSENTPSQ